MVIQDWCGSLAVGSMCSIFVDHLLRQKIRSTNSHEPGLFLLVPFRVNSWIALVQAEINTKPIKAGLACLIPRAVLNRP